mgnify:CR=1 FL=1
MSPSLLIDSTSQIQAASKLSSKEGASQEGERVYKYAHLLPTFTETKYPPLKPFQHVDPGFRALNHSNPRAFLENAEKVYDLTPHLGTVVEGVSLAQLDSDGRDQLALEVSAPCYAVSRKARLLTSGWIGRSPWSDGFSQSTRIYRPWTRLLSQVG